MSQNTTPFSDFCVGYFVKYDKWPEGDVTISDQWRPTVEGYVDGFQIDNLTLELMASFREGFVQDQIDQMSEMQRSATLEFLEEGREELTSILAVSIKCAAIDFGKRLEKFVKDLNAESIL